MLILQVSCKRLTQTVDIVIAEFGPHIRIGRFESITADCIIDQLIQIRKLLRINVPWYVLGIGLSPKWLHRVPLG